MKRVVESRMVAHLWANQSQDGARSSGRGNVFFEGNTIYSYGHHFPIARHVERKGRKAILFTTRGYSSTTAKHICRTRQAIASGALVFYVYDPSQEDHKRNLADYSKRIEEAAKKMKRARSSAEWHARQLESLVSEANQYAEFFSLKTRFAIPSDADIDSAIRKAREEQQKRAKQLEAKRARRDAVLAHQAEEWKRGECDSMPWDYSKILLRVRGSHLQTSRGAVVELSDAKKLLPLIRSGKEWHRNGQTIRVGSFELDAIEETGNVRIGCHYIEREEIERIAAEIGE